MPAGKIVSISVFLALSAMQASSSEMKNEKISDETYRVKDDPYHLDANGIDMDVSHAPDIGLKGEMLSPGNLALAATKAPTESPVGKRRPDSSTTEAPDADLKAPPHSNAPVSDGVKQTPGGHAFPKNMSARSDPARSAALKKYGGSLQTEKAVRSALAWLKDNQNNDGSWGKAENYKPALTGLALLAFLGHGETPASEEFGKCVLVAIEKLAEYGDSRNPLSACGSTGYGHMIVTYALAEAYAVTGIPKLGPILSKNISLTVKGQNSHGSYDYGYGLHSRDDTSLLGWASQALNAASSADPSTPGVQEAMANAVQALKNDVKGKRGFVYSNHPEPSEKNGSRSMTAVGTFILNLFGEGGSAEAQDGLDYLLKCFNSIKWGEEETWSLYTWYYQTHAYFQAFGGKGKAWSKWNRAFSSELIKNQKPEGRWNTPMKDAEIAKAKNKNAPMDNTLKANGENMFSDLDNSIYATSFCCLMLEVYYRYAPVAEGGTKVRRYSPLKKTKFP